MEAPIHRAVISVSDKTGISELANFLQSRYIEIISTGSTAEFLREQGIEVVDVSEVTGFPEILDGRVKTLHPHIHAGILADRRKEDHNNMLIEAGIRPIDLVVGNFYPFEDAVAEGKTLEEIIELIDIGGPTLLRAAAKNYHSVTVLSSPDDYPYAISQILAGGFSLEQRKDLAKKAFIKVLEYDLAIARWFSLSDNSTAPSWFTVSGHLVESLRYGENSHQGAALYAYGNSTAESTLAKAPVLWGKSMSYNNYVDTDTAWRIVKNFDEPAVAIIKHANPCGVAIAPEIATAYANAYSCDPLSAFGGVVAANRTITSDIAQEIKEVFTEVIIAPAFDPEAFDILSEKKNIRLITIPSYELHSDCLTKQVTTIDGGFLIQDSDDFSEHDSPSQWELVCGEPADAATLLDLEFAWKIARFVKSNAIVLSNNCATMGIGMGQVNRLDAAQLAVTRAGIRAQHAVAASDAFFPFADGLEVLIAAGIRAVIQPGGSLRDNEVIAAAKSAGITMYFTGVRHFAH